MVAVLVRVAVVAVALWVATLLVPGIGVVSGDPSVRLGSAVSPAEWALMREHVVVTSRYEWMFWDADWRQETWPV